MQFELDTADLDANTLIAALRPLDPDVRVAMDSARGRLEVIGAMPTAQVLDVLDGFGFAARPLEQEVHISGGSTCCGHCG